MKKKLIVAATAGALSLAAAQAFALENEFHGMYKFMGYQSNFFNGVGTGFFEDSHSGWFAEQRARLQYTAKANDNLKLVTHFELDTRFGGRGGDTASNTYTAKGDAGDLDADALTLETKNIYLDVNCPITGANVKAGLQPWADSYQSLFLLADMTGVIASKKFDPATVSLGWFRFDDNTLDSKEGPGQDTSDLLVLDGKFAVNKDIKVGASYYNVQNDSGTTTPSYELLHMFGVNADLTFGPANIKPFAAYQIGEQNDNDDIGAFLAGAVAKIKAGPGVVNVSAIYLSGDDDIALGDDRDDFRTISAGATYFNPANMWLLVRSGQAVNSSTSVLGNDLTVGGRGLIGVFAGYEGTMDKIFYNANIGWAQTAEERGTEDGAIGTEINAQVGYKLFDNLSISVAGAYAILGDGLSGDAADLLKKTATTNYGAADADDPYMINTQLSYTF